MVADLWNGEITNKKETYRILKAYFNMVEIPSWIGCDRKGEFGLLLRLRDADMGISANYRKTCIEELVGEAGKLAQENGWEIKVQEPYDTSRGINIQRISLVPKGR